MYQGFVVLKGSSMKKGDWCALLTIYNTVSTSIDAIKITSIVSEVKSY